MDYRKKRGTAPQKKRQTFTNNFWDLSGVSYVTFLYE